MPRYTVREQQHESQSIYVVYEDDIAVEDYNDKNDAMKRVIRLNASVKRKRG